MKPKSQGRPDDCWTPPYAIDPLLPYIKNFKCFWEQAYGNGDLFNAIHSKVPLAKIVGSDLSTDDDFLDKMTISNIQNETGLIIDAIITNPPYSKKFDFIDRCYEIGLPFALLMPVETLGSGTKAQPNFIKHGIEIMLLDTRVGFKMPEKQSWIDSSAQFPTAWFCHNLLPDKLMFGSIKQTKKQFVESEKAKQEMRVAA